MIELMKRVDPEEVLHAYKTYDIKPIRFTFKLNSVEGGFCGCGLTAFSMKNGIDISKGVVSALKEEGFSSNYLWGFANGFDGGSLSSYPVLEEELGFLDGQETLKLVNQAIENKQLSGFYEGHI